MAHGYTRRDDWLIDREGRHALLRGVNLGGSSKVPFAPNGATHLGVDFAGWRDVSFVGRPFPLDEADRHLDRIAHWGFNVLRLLTPWEAIEHAGPGEYDEPYLDYVREVTRRAGERGLRVFIDPHHDVWSRWTGGDGAPFWCFELAGLQPERFVAAEAVALDAPDWPSNYGRAVTATMWTLFWAGDVYCPELSGVQDELQSRYIGAVSALAERISDLDNVLGYDTLNEPGFGYIGRGDDMKVGHQIFRLGEPPFSSLEYLAAAEGNAVRDARGRVLNPRAVSIWKGDCPWRRAGVWDLGPGGAPVLANPEYFRHYDGRPVEAFNDFVVPFALRLRDSLRRAHPGCFLFVESAPSDFAARWDDPDPLFVDGRHWYDIASLATRKFDPDDYRGLGGEALSGTDEIAEFFTAQLSALKGLSRERMGNPPLLIGEFGIPYEMNDGEAYLSGDYSKHEAALDANYRALDAILASSTQWNYTADSSHQYGDQWNREDLSIFSPDDQTDPEDLDSGGRAVAGFSRPYAPHAAGRPLAVSFDRETRTFELEVESDPEVAAPTVVFVPRVQYPNGVRVEVSAGETSHDEKRQRLEWQTDVRGRVTLRMTPA